MHCMCPLSIRMISSSMHWDSFTWASNLHTVCACVYVCVLDEHQKELRWKRKKIGNTHTLIVNIGRQCVYYCQTCLVSQAHLNIFLSGDHRRWNSTRIRLTRRYFFFFSVMDDLSDRLGQVHARTLSSDRMNSLIELEMNGRILMKRLFFTPNIFYSPDDESAAKKKD